MKFKRAQKIRTNVFATAGCIWNMPICDRAKRVDDFFLLLSFIILNWPSNFAFLLCVCAYHMLGRLTTRIAERNKKFVYNFGLGLKANLFFSQNDFLLTTHRQKLNNFFAALNWLHVFEPNYIQNFMSYFFPQRWTKFANGNWKGQMNLMREL